MESPGRASIPHTIGVDRSLRFLICQRFVLATCFHVLRQALISADTLDSVARPGPRMALPIRCGPSGLCVVGRAG